jgi:urease accessory protein
MKSKSILALLALTYAGAALAHPGHADGAMAGLMHPLTGIDHVLAMLAVGLWGAQLGGRAQWLLPASFVALLAVGGALGMSGAALPMVEAGIVTSVLLLGLLIGFAVKLKTLPAATIVGVFAVFHGFAHGAEMPAMSTAWWYGVGFVAASAALHGVGLWLGRAVRADSRWLRTGGGVISLAGLWLGMAA